MDNIYEPVPKQDHSLLPWRVRVNGNTIAAFESARQAGDYVSACGAPEGSTYDNMMIVFINEAI